MPSTVAASVPPAGIYVVLRIRIKISWISLPGNFRATVSLLFFVYLSLLPLLLLFITITFFYLVKWIQPPAK